MLESNPRKALHMGVFRGLFFIFASRLQVW